MKKGDKIWNIKKKSESDWPVKIMRTKQPRIVEVLLKLKTFIPFMIGHIGRVSWEYATTLTNVTPVDRPWRQTCCVKIKLKLCNADIYND